MWPKIPKNEPKQFPTVRGFDSRLLISILSSRPLQIQRPSVRWRWWNSYIPKNWWCNYGGCTNENLKAIMRHFSYQTCDGFHHNLTQVTALKTEIKYNVDWWNQGRPKFFLSYHSIPTGHSLRIDQGVASDKWVWSFHNLRAPDHHVRVKVFSSVSS